ncbi:hypothetical protein MPTK1_3g16340 [Marchantia polymorpha subsp. ruderalis]|uniref:J domain-containing protein n=2 Tax=Marchantia polymorpha TaxID=3197 RepID=A0AAF6B1F4_MARPO|nr:hypothetical protein MARPO_0004s0037 [Marchantia polymorpha]BBN05838.1 hypothetical protein Mp_3g16340 [Marchantia polymorpha subsp. ruderalis]|eukprot:PTQ48739.1 hypothetical protein MARPO_0004s0037 [Marchantia polymorpha]
MAHVILGCGSPLASSPPTGFGLSSSCRSTFSNDPLRRSLRVKKRSQGVESDKPSVEVCASRNLTEAPTSPTADPFSTLGVDEYASKSEVKHVYRRLALQYHPDVCRGDHCALMFTQINIAYEKVMNYISAPPPQVDDSVDDNPEGFYGVGDDSWDEWEEWMGWEGAGTTDYSSHINPSI